VSLLNNLSREVQQADLSRYMFGPRLLIAPVTEANVSEWTVYLPITGSNASKPWTYWWTNETYAGGDNVTVPAPLEHIPVFHLGSRADIMDGDVF
jgi:alpha-glucosidase (family GH31 glycosyl hydrolase)